MRSEKKKNRCSSFFYICYILLSLVFISVIWMYSSGKVYYTKDEAYYITGKILTESSGNSSLVPFLNDVATEEITQYVKLLKENTLLLVFQVIFAAIGGFTLVLYLFLGADEAIRKLKYTGIFSILVAVYGMSLNLLIKLLMQNSYLLFIIEYCSMLFLVPIVLQIVLLQVKSKSKKKITISAILLVIAGFIADRIYANTTLSIVNTPFFMIGSGCYLIIQIQDMLSEIRKRKRELYQSEMYRRLAYTDYLTKVKNRYALVEDALEYTKLKSTFIWCIFIDVNNLKEVNDKKGHIHGDHIIREMVTILNLEFSTCGTVYRMGGDEFIILIPNKDRRYMEEKIKRLNEYRSDNGEDKEEKISFALGYDCLREEESIEELIARVDHLMYQDKEVDKRKNMIKEECNKERDNRN